MADAASATATTTTPHAAGAGCNVPIDSDTIRQSYEAVLSASRFPSGDDVDRLGGLLRGHIQLLVPELAGVEPCMLGAQQRTARRVLTRTRHMLKEPIAGTPRGVWDLAIQCRALLTLHEYPGPLRARPIAGGRA